MTNNILSSDTNFTSHGFLTLGAEIELQLIDPKSLNLTPRFEEFFATSNSYRQLKPEFYLSSAEINTDKCNNVQEIEQDLIKSYQAITKAGKLSNIDLATTGCHPFSRYSDCVITPSDRYNELIDRNQWLTRRMTVYGLHVHIGMKNGDEYVRFSNFFLHFLPHLLALSASSPFWQGDDTGLAACRPTTYESLPTAGQPYQTKNWHEFEELYRVLKKCRAIDSLKDLWWDIRPSPGYGTMEIRVCDGVATLSEALAIIAFIHLLANWFNDNGSWLEEIPAPHPWIARENKWRAIRHGLEAEIVINPTGETRPIGQDILEWLERFAAYEKQFGYQDYMKTLRNIITYGNSSSRQLKVFNRNHLLSEVVKFNIAEFNHLRPIWQD
jgi:carboxylate-amine ligase